MMFFTNHFFIINRLLVVRCLRIFFFFFFCLSTRLLLEIYRLALLLSFFLSFLSFILCECFLLKNVSPILASTNDLKERYVEGFKGCLDRQLWIEVKRICFGAYPNPVRRRLLTLLHPPIERSKHFVAGIFHYFFWPSLIRQII